ncbi:MAG TPA: cupredoxin domain-containing protein [Thermoanaerobaculia bacterium]|jgi:cytochrome c oxidase subunit 2
MIASRIAVLPLSLAVFALATLASFAQDAAAPAAPARKITVTARKYEFNPAKIEMKVGEPVEITLQAEDTTHGFTCKDLGVEKVVVEKGQSQSFVVTPQKAGTYEFKCAKWCGFGHGKMKGEIVVTAADASKN